MLKPAIVDSITDLNDLTYWTMARYWAMPPEADQRGFGLVMRVLDWIGLFEEFEDFDWSVALAFIPDPEHTWCPEFRPA